MRTLTRRWTVLCAVVLLSGCAAEHNEPVKVETVASKLSVLTAEQARQALVTMLERPDEDVDWLYRLSADLRGPIEEREDGRVRIGHWTCDLSEKKFWAHAAFVRPKGPHQGEGVFEQQADGTWVARVTGTCRPTCTNRDD